VSAAAALLDELKRQGVSLWADGERIRFRAPRGVVTPELREQLAQHRDQLLARLRLPPAVGARGGGVGAPGAARLMRCFDLPRAWVGELGYEAGLELLAALALEADAPLRLVDFPTAEDSG
jgi:hypothetical protein